MSIGGKKGEIKPGLMQNWSQSLGGVLKTYDKLMLLNICLLKIV